MANSTLAFCRPRSSPAATSPAYLVNTSPPSEYEWTLRPISMSGRIRRIISVQSLFPVIYFLLRAFCLSIQWNIIAFHPAFCAARRIHIGPIAVSLSRFGHRRVCRPHSPLSCSLYSLRCRCRSVTVPHALDFRIIPDIQFHSVGFSEQIDSEHNLHYPDTVIKHDVHSGVANIYVKYLD